MDVVNDCPWKDYNCSTQPPNKKPTTKPRHFLNMAGKEKKNAYLEKRTQPSATCNKNKAILMVPVAILLYVCPTPMLSYAQKYVGQTCVCCDKSFVLTSILLYALGKPQHVFVATNIIFVTTNSIFWWQIFVMTNILLSQQKTCFVATKLLLWQKWYLWQLPPIIHTWSCPWKYVENSKGLNPSYRECVNMSVQGLSDL